MPREGAPHSEKQIARRNSPRKRSYSAQALEDWIDVVFAATGRAVRGMAPLAVFVFASVELVNPDMLGRSHISSELAQTLLGGALGAMGIDIIGRRGRRR